jgi:hypothetical protein
VKVTLVVDVRSYAPVSRIEPGMTVVEFDLACPSCGAPAPIIVRGLGVDSHDHDTYQARARHLGCDAVIGALRTKVDTIFGIEEDERVLAGPWRVY